MKKILLILFIYLFTFVPAVSAQTGASLSAAPIANSAYPTITSVLTEAKKEVLTILFTTLSVRLGTAVNRLDTIGKRLSSRLLILKTNGTDTTVLGLKLQAAQDKNLETKKILDQSAVAFQNVLSSPKPADQFVNLKQSLNQVRDQLRGTLEAYRQIIEEMKLMAVPTMGVTVAPSIMVPPGNSSSSGTKVMISPVKPNPSQAAGQ